MTSGKKGMGSHKHGVSGHAPRTPGYKLQQAREANALADEERARKPKAEMFASVQDALRKRRR